MAYNLFLYIPPVGIKKLNSIDNFKGYKNNKEYVTETTWGPPQSDYYPPVCQKFPDPWSTEISYNSPEPRFKNTTFGTSLVVQ